MEHAPGASYLVFLKRLGNGWQTLEAYKVEGGTLALGSQSGPGWPDRLVLSEGLYRSFLPQVDARTGEGFQSRYGTLWQVEPERVPLAPVLAAIEAIGASSSVKPPNTGGGGLR